LSSSILPLTVPSPRGGRLRMWGASPRSVGEECYHAKSTTLPIAALRFSSLVGSAMAVGAANGCMYLVDAHSLIFQVFHAIPEMSSPSGLPTNALYGFTRDMLYLRTEKKPDYLLAVFDRPGKTFRDALYPEYKAQRAPAPDDLHIQIPLICETLEAMRVPVLGVDGYEADDVIATVAAIAAVRGMDVFICTTDKDCRQLISDRVRLFNLRKHAALDRDGMLQG